MCVFSYLICVSCWCACSVFGMCVRFRVGTCVCSVLVCEGVFVLVFVCVFVFGMCVRFLVCYVSVFSCWYVCVFRVWYVRAFSCWHVCVFVFGM